MHQSCKQCGTDFEITEDDLRFYEEAGPTLNKKKFLLPHPTLCPSCRMQRRISFRNFFNLCHRKSDLSGEPIISMYDNDVPFPVYELHEWWSDKWDGRTYGKDIDFNRPFFDQLKEVFASVPRMSIFNTQCENSSYCNFSFQSRNCYMIGGNVENEDCCYGHIVWQSKSCFDCLYTYRSERCYECIDCVQCYNITYSRACENCSDSQFLVHCAGCKNCFGCVGIKNKEYCFMNEQLTKEEYMKRIGGFDSSSLKQVQQTKDDLQSLTGKEITKHYHGINCENVTGDYLYYCKNVFDSFDAKNCEDSRYLATVETFIRCYDCNYCPAKSELCYECVAAHGYNLLFCHNCPNQASNLIYCQDCPSCKDCFGCQSLRGQQYCIFNKQYEKEEYMKLSEALLEHMRETNEWGEFYDVTMSPFGYNQTMAYEYFPITQNETESRGWKWKENEQKTPDVAKIIPAEQLPDSLESIPDDVLNWAIKCKNTKKPFKIIKQELDFYRQMELPMPRLHPDERHRQRMKLKNPRKLWKRECDKCQKEIQTTYAPERPEKVYCEECYLKEVY